MKAKRKVLARCPEFVCYEMPDGQRRVESSPEVERAYWKAAMRITDAGDADKGRIDRVQMATALLSLEEYSAGHAINSKAVLKSLSETLGQLILDVMETPIRSVRVPPERKALLQATYPDREAADWQTSRKETFKRAEATAESAGAAVRNAAIAIARWKMNPKESKRARDIVATARSMFRDNLQRPTKWAIREQLEAEGDNLKGKDSDRIWKEAFRAAGLESLPE
jgi:hypothetical protein